jgi:hypothetical protein
MARSSHKPCEGSLAVRSSTITVCSPWLCRRHCWPSQNTGALLSTMIPEVDFIVTISYIVLFMLSGVSKIKLWCISSINNSLVCQEHIQSQQEQGADGAAQQQLPLLLDLLDAHGNHISESVLHVAWADANGAFLLAAATRSTIVVFSLLRFRLLTILLWHTSFHGFLPARTRRHACLGMVNDDHDMHCEHLCLGSCGMHRAVDIVSASATVCFW